MASLKSCGPGCIFRLPIVIEGPEFVSVGARVSVASYFHIWGHGGVEIGDDCLIASHVAITSITHDKKSGLYSDKNISNGVKIRSSAEFGIHAVILPGVKISDNAIIGAGAVVTSNVPRGAIFVGIPARDLNSR